MGLTVISVILILNMIACSISLFGSSWGLYRWMKDLRWTLTAKMATTYQRIAAIAGVAHSILRVFCSLLLFALAISSIISVFVMDKGRDPSGNIGLSIGTMGYMLFTVALAGMGVVDMWYRARTQREFKRQLRQ